MLVEFQYETTVFVLILLAMLRDKSVFVDGGVQLYRKNGTTWLGFSELYFLTIVPFIPYV